MFICNKCNKKFKFESDYIRHQSRKTDCNKNNNFNCTICNSNFNYKSDYLRHKKTKKHIINTNINIDINTNNKLINYENEYNILKNDYDSLKENYNNLKNDYDSLKNELINYENKYNKIILKNNELLNENKLLKLNSNINLDHHEQIYIIHERTFVELNANIYKIGKTKNIKNRLNGYTKGSKLLFSIACKDCTESENKILNFLKNNEKYIHAKEYGNEYFQCNLQDLMSDIYNLILH
jgi:hypothetical protein